MMNRMILRWSSSFHKQKHNFNNNIVRIAISSPSIHHPINHVPCLVIQRHHQHRNSRKTVNKQLRDDDDDDDNMLHNGEEVVEEDSSNTHAFDYHVHTQYGKKTAAQQQQQQQQQPLELKYEQYKTKQEQQHSRREWIPWHQMKKEKEKQTISQQREYVLDETQKKQVKDALTQFLDAASVISKSTSHVDPPHLISNNHPFYNNRIQLSHKLLSKHPLHAHQNTLHLMFSDCFKNQEYGKARAILNVVKTDLLNQLDDPEITPYDKWFYAEMLIKYYNFVISTAGRIKDLEAVEAIYNEINKSKVIQPNAGTYACVLNACTSVKNLEKFDYYFKLFNPMKPYSQHVYQALMHRSFMQKDYQTVLEIYSEMRLCNTEVNSRDIFVMLITVVSRANMNKTKAINTIRGIIQTASDSDMSLADRHFVMSHAVITILDIDVSLAVAILEEYSSTTSFELSNHIFTKLMLSQFAKNGKDKEGILSIWNYARSINLNFDEISLDAALYAALSNDQIELAREVWDYYFSGNMKEHLPNSAWNQLERFYTKMMHYVSIEGDLSKADQLLEHMQRVNAAPKASLFSYLLRCYLHPANEDHLRVNARNILESAFIRHEDIRDRKLESISFMNHALKVALVPDTPDAFFYVFRQLESSYIKRKDGYAWYKTYEYMCNTIIKACFKFYESVDAAAANLEIWDRVFKYLVLLLDRTLDTPHLLVGRTIRYGVRFAFREAQMLSLTFFKKYGFREYHEQVLKNYRRSHELMGKVEGFNTRTVFDYGFQKSDFLFDAPRFGSGKNYRQTTNHRPSDSDLDYEL